MTTPAVRFEDLIDRHHDEIHSYLWRLVTSASEADDLTQEVFLRAYGAFAHLRPDSNHRAWLYKIATHCAYTSLQKAQRQNARHVALHDEIHAFPASENRSPAQQTIINEALEAVRREIAALPAKQQAAVVLRHVQGLGYAKIAHALDCSEDSARANVYQGLRRLRRVLAEDWS